MYAQRPRQSPERHGCFTLKVKPGRRIAAELKGYTSVNIRRGRAVIEIGHSIVQTEIG